MNSAVAYLLFQLVNFISPLFQSLNLNVVENGFLIVLLDRHHC